MLERVCHDSWLQFRCTVIPYGPRWAEWFNLHELRLAKVSFDLFLSERAVCRRTGRERVFVRDPILELVLVTIHRRPPSSAMNWLAFILRLMCGWPTAAFSDSQQVAVCLGGTTFDVPPESASCDDRASLVDWLLPHSSGRGRFWSVSPIVVYFEHGFRRDKLIDPPRWRSQRSESRTTNPAQRTKSGSNAESLGILSFSCSALGRGGDTQSRR